MSVVAHQTVTGKNLGDNFFRTEEAHAAFPHNLVAPTYVFFVPPLFCQTIPTFWTQNLG